MGKKQALLDAAKGGNAQEVSRILNSSSSGVTAVSAKVGKVAQKVGMKVVPLVNKSDENGATALHLAALEGYIEVVRVLLNNHAQVGLLDNRSCSVLHYACYRGQETVLSDVIAHAKSNQSILTSNQSVAGRSSQRASTQLGNVDLLDLNGQNADGETALHVAAMFNHSKCVSVLLESGSNPLLVNQTGEMPLDVAVRNGNIGAARVLTSHIPQAVKRIRKVTGQSAMHEAAKRGDLRMLRVLIDSGFEVNATNELGTALHVAALCRKVDAFALLLATESCDTQLRDGSSKTVRDLLSDLQDQSRRASAVGSTTAESISEMIRLLEGGVDLARRHVADLPPDSNDSDKRELVGNTVPLPAANSENSAADADKAQTARRPRPPRPTTRPFTMMNRSTTVAEEPTAAGELHVHVAEEHRAKDDSAVETESTRPVPKARVTKMHSTNEAAAKLGALLSGSEAAAGVASKQDAESKRTGVIIDPRGSTDSEQLENVDESSKPAPPSKPKPPKPARAPAVSDEQPASSPRPTSEVLDVSPTNAAQPQSKPNPPPKPASASQTKPPSPPVHPKSADGNQTHAPAGTNPPPIARKPTLSAAANLGVKAVASSAARFPCLSELSEENVLTLGDIFGSQFADSASVNQMYEAEDGSLHGFLSQLDLQDHENAFISTGFNSLSFINGMLDAKDLSGVLQNAGVNADAIAEAVTRLPNVIGELRRRDFASVVDWLAALELDVLYAGDFTNAGYAQMAECYAIWPSDLTRIGVLLLGHRKRILESLYAMKQKLADSLLPTGVTPPPPQSQSQTPALKARTWWPFDPFTLLRGYAPFRVILVSADGDREEYVNKPALLFVSFKSVKFFDATAVSSTSTKPLPLLEEHDVASVSDCNISKLSAAESQALASVKPHCTFSCSYRLVSRDTKQRASMVAPFKVNRLFIVAGQTQEHCLDLAKTLAEASELADTLAK